MFDAWIDARQLTTRGLNLLLRGTLPKVASYAVQVLRLTWLFLLPPEDAADTAGCASGGSFYCTGKRAGRRFSYNGAHIRHNARHPGRGQLHVQGRALAVRLESQLSSGGARNVANWPGTLPFGSRLASGSSDLNTFPFRETNLQLFFLNLGEHTKPVVLQLKKPIRMGESFGHAA